jgi:methionine synthase II (cobalamin-independent)
VKANASLEVAAIRSGAPPRAIDASPLSSTVTFRSPAASNAARSSRKLGDPAAPLADIDNLKAALAEANVAGAFLNAASPGVISLFFRNDHYANQEAYLLAIAEAMRSEYEAIAAAGVILQIDESWRGNEAFSGLEVPKRGGLS